MQLCIHGHWSMPSSPAGQIAVTHRYLWPACHNHHQTPNIDRTLLPEKSTVTWMCKREHVALMLYELHWLLVAQQITFKILTLTYQALHGLVPAYRKELIVSYQSMCTLRSTDASLLVIPASWLCSCGDHSFSLWGGGSLPLEFPAKKHFLCWDPSTVHKAA